MPHSFPLRCLAALLIAGACAPGMAEIYRCKQPDGRISYQDKECFSGEQQRATRAATAAPEPAGGPRLVGEPGSPAWRMQVREAVASGQAMVGMTMAELLEAVGGPDRQQYGGAGSGEREQLIYQRGARTMVVHVTAGVVKAVQFKQGTAPAAAGAYATNSPSVRAPVATCPSEAEIRRLRVSADNSYIKGTQAEADLRQRLRQAESCTGPRADGMR